ncbi:MAG: hypothetical protein EOP46_08850 [Sphingobacteriaceae bacterium]|nr:MAG: hypothetical protein EOP46_08850 [Sphingobacteriaceae bacterium]
MEEYYEQFTEWLTSLGEEHNVDPLTLGSLYLISKLSFFTLLGFVIKNLRAKKPVTLLILFAGLCFSIPYTYIIIAGRNISVWIYIFIAALFIYGIYSIWRTVKTKREQLDAL